MPATTARNLHLCHHCDQLHELVELSPGENAFCIRCGSSLASNRDADNELSLALVSAAIPTFLIANCFPIITLNLIGNTQSSLLITGVIEFAASGLWPLAILVFLTSIFLPGIYLVGLLYVLLPLQLDIVPPAIGPIFRWLARIEAWNMLEIFMLGILVALTKLGTIADLVLGPALYAFIGLIILTTTNNVVLNKAAVWNKIPLRTGSAGE
ncbi:MAG: paraquat-inducible protein A [Gammaproteobacteria bacterium]